MKSKWIVLGVVLVAGMLVLGMLILGAMSAIGRGMGMGFGTSGRGVTVVVPSTEFSWNMRDGIPGSGDVVTEDVPVRDFDSVAMAGIGDVIVTQGETESLTIETDDNILPYIEAQVRNGTLVIGLSDEADDKSLDPTKLVFHVSMKDVAGLDVSGAGNISAESIGTDDLKIDISGAGDIDVDALTTERLTVNLNGAGAIDVDALDAEQAMIHLNGASDVTLAGKVERQEVYLNGAGNYRCGDLESQTTHIELAGAGNAVVWATDTLEAGLYGVGNVRYYGDPYTRINRAGLGTVLSMGDR